ncbi:glycoside hydrolase family 3 protein [Plantactinospora mayteni]|uniref:Beta-glucosidase n=1 Tax=Plantactinospora mayteni TaxID=566021 RepID=A0ABQ4F1U3_9ACTN|nr:glycoside hydrolase family 3 protein [Plantactinospora mayteni]GIH00884.1 beta-glucosidase [Plantactinospora mayteni]
MTDTTFRDPDQPLNVRVADLLDRLTRAEKIALLHQRQAPVPRLGLPAFRTGTEALHGLAWLGPATVFPQALGLGSSWNPELIRAVGAAVGDEVRGLHQKDPTRVGLNVWAPVVNPLRDPRWGRNEEGYAEDPWLTSWLGTAYARGLRGDHPDYLKTAPTLKHFLGYNNETDRCTTSSNLPPRVLYEYELPAFRAPIATGAAVAVMASYNLVNGRPAHLSPLIGAELRHWTSDEIMVVSDAGAISNIAGAQGYHPDHPSGYAAALRAGIDSFTEDDEDSGPTVERLTEALRRGLLDESDLDTAVRRILTVRFRLGDFDPPERNPYSAITADVINCPAHQELAREAARQSLVLLRNVARPGTGAMLPLDPARIDRLAVLGPLADTLYEDWYSGTLPYAITARDGLAARFAPANTTYHCGADRIALRIAGGYVRAAGDPEGAALRLHQLGSETPSGGVGTTGGAAGPATGNAAGGDTGATGVAGAVPTDGWFEVFGWGQDVIALRSVANGRHVGAGEEDGLLVNDRPGPGGWVVRETFRLVDRAAGDRVLYHLGSERYVRIGPDGLLRADAVEPADGTGFTVELVADGAAEAAALARDADVAVVVLGNHPMVCGRETEDRADLALPAAQEALLRAVHAANPRTVLVVSSSYPYAVNWADEHLPAILWSAHGGQEYGTALAAVLAGDADPGGRLTQTWYHDAAELPDLFDYDVIATDTTYLYHRGTPLYPFGHGLSYAEFAYSDLRLSADEVDAAGEIEVSVRVTNVGSRPGDEVVQLYTRQRRSRVKQPLRQLRGFARVSLAPGARTTVRLRLRAGELAHWDVPRGRYVVEDARHTVAVGRSSADLLLTATLAVHGEPVRPREPLAGPLWAVDHDEYAGTEPLPDGPEGAAVVAREAGGWIRFSRVDFGTGVAGLTARVGGQQPLPDGAELVLRLDDPVRGPVAGTIPVPPTGTTSVPSIIPVPPTGTVPVLDTGSGSGEPGSGGPPDGVSAPDRQPTREVTGRWHGAATGVRDLYLLFDTPGATVSWLTFMPRVPGEDDGVPGDRTGKETGGA